MTDIGIGIVGGGYMGKAHAVAMSSVGAVFNTTLRPDSALLLQIPLKVQSGIRRLMALKTPTRTGKS